MTPARVSAPDAFRFLIGSAITAATMPGMITMNGTNIFGNAPMIGALRAEASESDAIARWTSTKFVVQ